MKFEFHVIIMYHYIFLSFWFLWTLKENIKTMWAQGKKEEREEEEKKKEEAAAAMDYIWPVMIICQPLFLTILYYAKSKQVISGSNEWWKYLKFMQGFKIIMKRL